MTKTYFTSEAVTEGHPDKICDQIADAILDDLLRQDPFSRAGIEVAATTGLVLVMGEVTTTAYVDIQKIVRQTVKKIGYDRGKYGFDAENLAVLVALDEQSPDIAQGVRSGAETGAGDQGLMFGYATTETPELMPAPIYYAQQLALKLAEVRKKRVVKYLRPDGKTQITAEYHDGRLARISSVVVSTQHDEKVSLAELREFITEKVIKAVLPAALIDSETEIFINPTGRFVIGGPKGDSGLTGRKLIVDSYGGVCRHGGGAISGKDATKVDRSAAYLARYIAKNLVAAGVAEQLEIGLSYVIGVSQPTSIMVDAKGTSKYSAETIADVVRAVFPLTPGEIIEQFALRKPGFSKTACYGQFGRSDLALPWERTDKVAEIKRALKG